jgi:hypothetical protein
MLQMHKHSNTAQDFDDIRYRKLTKYNFGKKWFTSLDKGLNIFLTKILNLRTPATEKFVAKNVCQASH